MVRLIPEPKKIEQQQQCECTADIWRKTTAYLCLPSLFTNKPHIASALHEVCDLYHFLFMGQSYRHYSH